MQENPTKALIELPRSFKVIHFTTVLLFIILLFTGAILYISPLEALVGNRTFVAYLHVASGVMIFVPFGLSLTNLESRPALAGVYKELSRWSPDDGTGLLSVPRKGKRFNGGQKLMANALLGSLMVLLLTGLVMASYIPLSISMRQGATFTHDLVAFLVTALFMGHLFAALAHPRALRSVFRLR
ncbi:formate dehydrogenase subunit gamma [Ferrithrix thermotolerans DSM 19514]|uniref:Formate dehydrogenase subunit gamma n=1 Tax=Ferrithrix thermotolerans DSM 19514 TaxID=1121881 RepID=A0A1M4U4D2_9ACTN|nr:cytochrome b/b6 domain-containing protein [Ferrithrix thermotolerans]SHE51513.1 formate dehydrogenase subunit gamma [Ferrithrix thermotolerans DSM 19514]